MSGFSFCVASLLSLPTFQSDVTLLGPSKGLGQTGRSCSPPQRSMRWAHPRVPMSYRWPSAVERTEQRLGGQGVLAGFNFPNSSPAGLFWWPPSVPRVLAAPQFGNRNCLEESRISHSSWYVGSLIELPFPNWIAVVLAVFGDSSDFQSSFTFDSMDSMHSFPVFIFHSCKYGHIHA